MAGDPKFDASQDLPDFPYARYAELLGLERHPRRRARRRSAPAWDEALARRPAGACSRSSTDPDVPPLPPHITLEQAKNFALATAKDPARGAMIGHAMRQMIAAIAPRRR